MGKGIDMQVKEMAAKMMKNGQERKEAEKMMGKSFADMSKEQRVLAATVLAAFADVVFKDV